MHVVMAASEAAPLAKTGGLADVVGALPAALQQLGAKVSVVLPAYRAIDRVRSPLQPTGWSITVPISGRQVSASVWVGKLAGGVPVYLPQVDAYFDRDGLYGTAAGDFLDNAERFAFFSRAVLAIAERIGPPDIIHCHDWQTGLAPAFLRADAARYPTLVRTKTVMTIHNLAYQGLFWSADWHLLNLHWQHFRPEEFEFYGKVNYLKAGLVFADAITTVSPTYAAEIQTAEFGWGLEGVLQARRTALHGILNGVDYQEWNPETDTHLIARYSAEDLTGKARCKSALQRHVGLPVEPTQPLLGIVSRLADQKGFDLLAEVLPTLLRRKVQLVVLGSGDARYHTLLANLSTRFPRQVGVRIAFDNPLAHQIEAGADIFVMPSRYEPCGLNQIYSLRYGTIPVVHATGGLQDTITEADLVAGTGTGFKFREYTADALLACLGRALAAYRRPKVWRPLIRNAMAADFSWQHSAEQYMELYRRLVPPDIAPSPA